jgi:3-deoxy-D-manno-octulosonate 8-phosphate phosphatase (KDO 8-P phosphatase)
VSDTPALSGAIARRIRFLVLDADGVLTDGGIYVADGVGGEPFQLRRFHVRDGVALYLLRESGIEVAVVSGRSSPAVLERARELEIDEVHQVGPWEKVAVVGELLERRGLGWGEVACLADDLADLALLERVALPAAVADAAAEVRGAALWCSSRPGGQGAVREFGEALLRARGEWEERVAAYVARARVGGTPE